jgi:hypothetical protein
MLVVLGAGAGLGAALGAAVTGPGTSPAEWMANVLATTGHSGSARFTYSQITTSRNVYLAQQTHGSGQIDFTSGNTRTTEVTHDIQFSSDGPGVSAQATPDTNRTEEIGVGKVTYLNIGVGIDLGRQQWLKTGLPRDPHATVATALAGNAGVALSSVAGDERVVAVRDLGSATVRRTPTTRYLVTTAPVCATPKSTEKEYAIQRRPTTLWVDAKGRLVQARSSESIDSNPPKSFFKGDPGLATRMRGKETTTATLDFSFGRPVHISAPPASAVRSPSGSSIGLATFGCSSKNKSAHH